MRQLTTFTLLLLLSALIADTQDTVQSQRKVKKMLKKASQIAKPECTRGAICFSGEVREGQPFSRRLNDSLDFVLRLPGGIDIVTNSAVTGCAPEIWVANPPFMAHHSTEIDAAYDWTAEDEVETSPREFRFFTNCEDYRTLSALAQSDAQEYLAKLESLAKGHGRLWITDSRLTHASDSVKIVGPHGDIEWIKFTAEIVLPDAN